VKAATLKNLVSPYDPSDTYYYITATDGHAWVLYVKDAKGKYVWRSDSTSALQIQDTPPTPFKKEVD